ARFRPGGQAAPPPGRHAALVGPGDARAGVVGLRLCVAMDTVAQCSKRPLHGANAAEREIRVVACGGFCRKVRFLGKIQKLCIGNSRTYRLPNSRKSNVATELPCPRGGDTTKHENGECVAGIYKATLQIPIQFVRFEPSMVPKKALTGESTERVDTRVLQVLYRFNRGDLPVYVGQQM